MRSFQREVYDPVTSDQIEALEICIINSRDVKPPAKKVLIWLLRQTRNLTRPVCLLMPNENPLGRVVSYSVHDMQSANGTTHIDVFMRAMQSDMDFSTHGGLIMGGETKSSGGYTVWIAPYDYDPEAELVQWDADAIAQTELRKRFTHSKPLRRPKGSHWAAPPR